MGIVLRNLFMGLAAIQFLVGPAPGAELAFDHSNEPEKQTALFLAGMKACRTFHTAFCQLAVKIGNGVVHHSVPPVIHFPKSTTSPRQFK